MARKAESEDLQSLASPEKLVQLRRDWRILHIGWAVIAALVLAGAAGIFGSGPLSTTTRTTQGLSVEFDRFVRRGTPFKLDATIELPPGTSEARLALPRGYFDGIRISSLLPHPIQVIAGREVVTFVFDVEETAPSLVVSIHAEALQTGLLDGAIITGDARLEFNQFVWP